MLIIRKFDVLCLMFLYTGQNSQVALYYVWRVGDSMREHRSEDRYIPYLDTYT